MENLLQEQFNFLIEIDKLKSIKRKTRIIHGSRLENDAEHSWHLAMMALILHQHANDSLDVLKVIKMLLVHDLVEIDAGDTYAYDVEGQVDKLEREMLAAKRIFAMLPAAQEQELMQLWLEYEKRETAEAKFASTLDRLQPLLHNYLNQGDTWKEHQITSEQVLKRNKEVAEGSEELWQYAQSLIKEAVKQGFLAK